MDHTPVRAAARKPQINDHIQPLVIALSCCNIWHLVYYIG